MKNIEDRRQFLKLMAATLGVSLTAAVRPWRLVNLSAGPAQFETAWLRQRGASLARQHGLPALAEAAETQCRAEIVTLCKELVFSNALSPEGFRELGLDFYGAFANGSEVVESLELAYQFVWRGPDPSVQPDVIVDVEATSAEFFEITSIAGGTLRQIGDAEEANPAAVTTLELALEEDLRENWDFASSSNRELAFLAVHAAAWEAVSDPPPALISELASGHDGILFKTKRLAVAAATSDLIRALSGQRNAYRPLLRLALGGLVPVGRDGSELLVKDITGVLA